MNRRDVLKALGALPIASAWAGCRHDEPEPVPTPATAPAVPVRTLQILLEGAFAVVLQRKTQRLTAFVPRPDPTRTDLAHNFYFNDPEDRKDLGTSEKPKSYQFVLPQDGLRTGPKPFINSDFNDFRAETQVWNHPPSLVSLDLPFPGSINFSGQPLQVQFASNARKRSGMMPTNYIIEYIVDPNSAAKIAMTCDQMGGRTLASPNCPPGIMRYYFGVGPEKNDPVSRQKHAVAFFNFMLERCFPQLKDKYALADPPNDQHPVYTRPSAFDDSMAVPALVPAVLQSTAPKPRLLRVASLVDCEIGGMLVETDTPASGH